MSKALDYNSSKTRVHPAFSVILNNPEPFFKLLKDKCGLPIDPSDETIIDIRFSGKSSRDAKEMSLPPTPIYLKWLIRNVDPERLKNSKLNHAKAERLKLVDPETSAKQQATADRLIDALDLSKAPPRKWFILEGCSKPDVFIQTNHFYLVIEGKRTESGPEIGTVWDEKRHQIIRHIEDLIQFSNNHKKLPCYGIFIIEESAIPDYHLERYANNEGSVYYDSLQHLTEKCLTKTFNEIRNAYKGFLTWQDLWQAYRFEKQPIRYIKHITRHATFYKATDYPCDSRKSTRS